MTLLPQGAKVHLAFGFIDMRKGINGLAMLVQGVLRQNPFSGHLFVFRGRKANLIKIVYWDGTGLCLFTKRLEHGAFLWPSATVAAPVPPMFVISSVLEPLALPPLITRRSDAELSGPTTVLSAILAFCPT